MMAEFEGRTALVTGGTKGIGRAIVRDLLESGFNVVFTARSQGDVAAAAQGLSESWPGRVLGLAADVRDPKACEEVVARVVAEFEGLDLLVNNAGVGRFSPIQEMSLEDWHAQIDTNLTGVFYLSRAAIPRLKESADALDPEHRVAGGRNTFAGGAGLQRQQVRPPGHDRGHDAGPSIRGHSGQSHHAGECGHRFRGSVRRAERRGGPSPSEDVSRAVLDLLRYPGNALPSRVELRPSQPPRKSVREGAQTGDQAMSDDFRIEKDSLGEIQVPAGALYGAQTQRAVENFPISGQRFPRRFIQALGLVKRVAAVTNGELGYLNPEQAQAIADAAGEVEEGQWDAEFVVDVYQTGSGTSTNMNANEVIARRAGQILDGRRSRVHPNDHVNFGQSSNDVIPTAMYRSGQRAALEEELAPSLAEDGGGAPGKSRSLRSRPEVRSHPSHGRHPGEAGAGVRRVGSTGRAGIDEELHAAPGELAELALGGTATGTGINTHPEFADRSIG